MVTAACVVVVAAEVATAAADAIIVAVVACNGLTTIDPVGTPSVIALADGSFTHAKSSSQF